MCVVVGGVNSKGEVRQQTSTCELYCVPGVCLCFINRTELWFTVQGQNYRRQQANIIVNKGFFKRWISICSRLKKPLS